MTTPTWSALADRLEAHRVEMARPDPFADAVIMIPVEERDELVAFLRAVPLETGGPVPDLREDKVRARVAALVEFARRPTSRALLAALEVHCGEQSTDDEPHRPTDACTECREIVGATRGGSDGQ